MWPRSIYKLAVLGPPIPHLEQGFKLLLVPPSALLSMLVDIPVSWSRLGLASKNRCEWSSIQVESRSFVIGSLKTCLPIGQCSCISSVVYCSDLNLSSQDTGQKKLTSEGFPSSKTSSSAAVLRDRKLDLGHFQIPPAISLTSKILPGHHV